MVFPVSVQDRKKPSNRPNLVLTVRHVLDPIHRYSVLRDALSSQPDGATIIYTGTRRDTEEVAGYVQNELGLNACYYHADVGRSGHGKQAFLIMDNDR
ncbi:MAG: hypothetical protein K0B14_06780 [Anaerolineaceae bacterium]|nr:hypothetical protein [Anaerolineaceae bacterium]